MHRLILFTILAFVLYLNNGSAQWFYGPSFSSSINVIDSDQLSRPWSNRVLHRAGLGFEVEYQGDTPLGIKSVSQWNFMLGKTQIAREAFAGKLEHYQSIEQLFLFNYRVVNSSIDFGPGYHYLRIKYADPGMPNNMGSSNTHYITANLQGSLYFASGLSLHLRLAHRLNSFATHRSQIIHQIFYNYLLIETRIKYNLQWQSA